MRGLPVILSNLLRKSHIRVSRLGFGLAVLPWLVAGVMVGPASSATLEEAVRAGLTNPEVREAAASRRAIDHDLREARALYYPTLDLRGSVGPEWFDTPTSSSNDQWLWERQGSVLVKQMIFDGYSTSSEVERQQARVSAAAARVVERSEFIALDVVQAYLDVLRQIDLVRYAEDNVRAHVATYQDVQRRVRAGRSGVGDQRQAESRLAQARADLVVAQRRLDDARAFYARLVGSEPLDLRKPALSEKTLPATLQQALNNTAANNPSVTVALRDIEAAEARARFTNAPFWPRLDLEVTGSQGHNVDGLQGDDDSFSALLVARWNLYSGGGDTARRRAALERVNEARERMMKIKIKADEETRRSWTALVRQREQAKVLGQRLASAEGVLAAYRQQFSIGQRDLLDVVDAQNDVFLARSRHTTAQYSALFAGYRVVAVSGDLLAAFKIKDPNEGAGGRAMSKTGMKRPATKKKSKK
jgi:adhesin transport system outer membrane protein